uniref:Uncharacterized protein n=1 Tax=Siphoviridae sp. ctqPo10 TaxID=2827948 RepID=A0A8S5SUF2_9CAUD|nr:MAG TPA: hypothetical protein [Siphoviridae sp. ctqPo10]
MYIYVGLCEYLCSVLYVYHRYIIRMIIVILCDI